MWKYWITVFLYSLISVTSCHVVTDTTMSISYLTTVITTNTITTTTTDSKRHERSSNIMICHVFSSQEIVRQSHRDITNDMSSSVTLRYVTQDDPRHRRTDIMPTLIPTACYQLRPTPLRGSNLRKRARVKGRFLYVAVYTRCGPTDEYAINKALFQTTCHPSPRRAADVGDDGGDAASIG